MKIKQDRCGRQAQAAALLALVLSTGAVWAGSLYNETTYYPLAGDRRAQHRPGDLLTVLVYENASATSTANTRAGRDAGIGLTVQLPHASKQAGIHANNDRDGGGQTRREGRVLAQLTVTVQEVAPNGDLIIGGEQLLDVNDERQQIRVSGRVRRLDVSEANTVLSTRIADARISYSGSGDIAERQRSSWWQRLLTSFGL